MYRKFISFGGISHNIYTKLYNSMVEPVLMYGSGIWGTKSYNVINYLFKIRIVNTFYLLEKNTSNISTRGDMGWLSCVSKQRISCVRLLCKLIRMEETRTASKIWRWTSRRRKGWNHDIQNEVNDLTFSTKFITKAVKEKIDVRDQEEWYDDRSF